jgi:hypothetical protein
MMGNPTDRDPLEASVESLLEGLGATQRHVSTWGGVLPLLTPDQRLMAAYGVYLALELIRERRRSQATIQGGSSERG